MTCYTCASWRRPVQTYLPYARSIHKHDIRDNQPCVYNATGKTLKNSKQLYISSQLNIIIFNIILGHDMLFSRNQKWTSQNLWQWFLQNSVFKSKIFDVVVSVWVRYLIVMTLQSDLLIKAVHVNKNIYVHFCDFRFTRSWSSNNFI